MADDVLDGPPPSPSEIQQAWERFKSAAETVEAKLPPPFNRIIPVAPNTPATAAIVLPGDDQRTGNGVSVRDYAKLAKACYDPKWGDPSSWTSPPGWTCVNANPDSVCGYASAEFVDANGNYVCAFRGTDGEWHDWEANIGQGMQLPTAQYDLAYGLARHLAIRFQDGILFTDAACTMKARSLTFTGHSLGGGLAGSAWTLTGYPTVTFNAAGVSLANRLVDNLQIGNDENQVGDSATEAIINPGGRVRTTTCTGSFSQLRNGRCPRRGSPTSNPTSARSRRSSGPGCSRTQRAARSCSSVRATRTQATRRRTIRLSSTT